MYYTAQDRVLAEHADSLKPGAFERGSHQNNYFRQVKHPAWRAGLAGIRIRGGIDRMLFEKGGVCFGRFRVGRHIPSGRSRSNEKIRSGDKVLVCASFRADKREVGDEWRFWTVQRKPPLFAARETMNIVRKHTTGAECLPAWRKDRRGVTISQPLSCRVRGAS